MSYFYVGITSKNLRWTKLEQKVALVLEL